MTLCKVVNENITKTKAAMEEDNAFLHSAEAVMNRVEDGMLSMHIEANTSNPSLQQLKESVNNALVNLKDKLLTINGTLEQYSNYDYTDQLKLDGIEQGSALEVLILEINQLRGAIVSMLNSSSDSANNLLEKSDILQTQMEELSGSSKQQAISLKETTQTMENIDSASKETSSKAKEVIDQSNDIKSVVLIISDIAEQTNLLALNAAIEAARAGEHGRGFAVVADEVQRLAERTGDATKQIETLVKAIQADTNEATMSMEQSTANVVKGARLTEKAGSALDRIEQVSMNLAQRILEISDSTKSQASASVKIAGTMGVIQEITQKLDGLMVAPAASSASRFFPVSIFEAIIPEPKSALPDSSSFMVPKTCPFARFNCAWVFFSSNTQVNPFHAFHFLPLRNSSIVPLA